jgi:hypothetical protein
MLKELGKNIFGKNFVSSLKPLGKSFVWLIFTVIFGLLPIWLVGVDSALTTKDFPFRLFLKNGSLMFFATAVVATITLDYLLSNQTFGKWRFDVFVFIVFPFVILVTCVALFYIAYKEPLENIEFEILCITECCILLLIFFYGIIVKFNAFIESGG